MRLRFLRWRYVVDWSLQGTLILHGLVYGSLVMLAVSLGIFSPLLWDLGAVELNGSYEEKAIVLLYLHERFWLLAAICLAIVVLGAIRFSHRVAGPMVRFKRNLRLLADGKFPPPLRTRRSDFLKQEVSCLNKAVAGVDERVVAIRRAQAGLRRVIETSNLTELNQPQQLEKITEACDAVDSALRMFEQVDTADEQPHHEPKRSISDLVSQVGGV